MQLFSVPEEELPIIRQLLHLQQASNLPERRAALGQLEAQGFTVRFARGTYELWREDKRVSLPWRRCPNCQKVQRLDAFLTKRQREHPWCQACRQSWPQLADRARHARDYQFSHGTLDLRSNERCANPSCPTGATIPLAQLRKGQRYCSRSCWRAVRTGPERVCENPGCSHLLRRDQRHYCSMTCRLAARLDH